MLNTASPFRAHSTEHVGALAAIAVAVVLTGLLARKWRGTRDLRIFAVSISVVFMANEIGCLIRQFLRDGFVMDKSLPLHLCDVSFWFSMTALLWPRQLLFEWAYFFGLGGAIQALITPELLVTFPDWTFTKFFASHGAIFVGVAILTIGFGMRPYPRSVPRMILAGTLYMVLAGIFDWLTNCNYGYMCHKPITPSLFDRMGPWPYYLISVEITGSLLICLLYLPYMFSDFMQARKAQLAPVAEVANQ